MLAEITKAAYTVAVAGTHGKTSTSSMLASLLAAPSPGPDANPGFCIGGEVLVVGANARQGSGELFVVEADESDGSFVRLKPHVALITNLEADHVDHYGSLEDIQQAFADFMQRVDADGTLVVCGDDEALLALARASGRRVVSYGAASGCDVRYTDIVRACKGSDFKLCASEELLAVFSPKEAGDIAGDPHAPEGGECVQGETIQQVEAHIALPGEHMVANACGAVATAVVLGFDFEQAARALAEFCGVRRRFDWVGEEAGITIVDDYAHHPTEIAATLRGARDLGFERIVVVFQPHRYSRTQAFVREFADAFQDADHLILLDIYSSGEAPIPGISGRTILEAVLERHPRTQASWLPRRLDVSSYLAQVLRAGDLLITMGAGDVTGVGSEYLRFCEQARGQRRSTT
jgi:UDP-N-acetylmuramate--alanine ligase